MEKIKNLIVNNFTTVFYSIVLLSTSLFLLMLRLKITQSFFLLFLVWNLFLAWLPYCISSFLIAQRRISKLVAFIGFSIWLLLLPNAPYIVTDFVHLQRSAYSTLWLDTIVIGSFVVSGLYGYISTIKHMRLFLKRYISEKKTTLVLISTHFLCGFGVYLGRFLRWNSWDIIQAPQTLFYDILNIIIHPIDHKVAWMTTIVFGVGLLLIDVLAKKKLAILYHRHTPANKRIDW